MATELPAADPEGSRARGPDPWWRIRLFHGMANDLRRRAPYYVSDWRDAWDYRVVPATVYMYFAKYASSLASVCYLCIPLPAQERSATNMPFASPPRNPPPPKTNQPPRQPKCLLIGAESHRHT